MRAEEDTFYFEVGREKAKSEEFLVKSPYPPLKNIHFPFEN